MCRSIKRLYFSKIKLNAPLESVTVAEPKPTTPDECGGGPAVRGKNQRLPPSKANAEAFERAVERIAADAEELLSALR